jgi:hypothetical protein
VRQRESWGRQLQRDQSWCKGPEAGVDLVWFMEGKGTSMACSDCINWMGAEKA